MYVEKTHYAVMPDLIRHPVLYVAVLKILDSGFAGMTIYLGTLSLWVDIN
jgi:hypothetical protein